MNQKLAIAFASILSAIFAVPDMRAEDPYIESDGTSGIDTGYRIKSTTRVEVDFALTSESQQDQARLFGADYNTTALNNAFGFYIGANNGNPVFVYGYGSKTDGWKAGWPKDSSGNFLYVDTNRHVATYDFPAHRHTFYTGAAAVAWQTEDLTYADEATDSFTIFATKTSAGAWNRQTKMRVYGVKVYEKTGETYELVHDFVPCSATGEHGFRDDLAVPGFRDRVTGKFIGDNESPESFSIGGDGVEVTAAPGFVATPSSGWASAAQYVDTLYIATDQTRCELDYSLSATPTASAWLFSGYGEATYGVYVKNGGTTFGFDNGGGWSGDPSISSAGLLNVRRTVVLDYPANKLNVISGSTTNVSVFAKAVQGKTYKSHSIKIAGRFNGGSEFAPLKIYGFKIFEAGTLVRDFLPCWRDGVPGLKDSLTGLFVSYPGTLGTKLSFGGDIAVEANPFIQTDYTCKQYFATGYQPINTTRFELDYSLTVTRPGGTWGLFRGINSTAYFGIYNNVNGLGFINGNEWKSGVTGTALADATGIRRTAILDNVANIAALVTAGVTNGSLKCENKLPSTPGGKAVTISCTEGFSDSEFSSLRVYACRIFENGAIVHEFIPSVKDGVPGLQDQLTDTFLPVLSKTKPNNNPYVFGGVFSPSVTPSAANSSRERPATLVATAPGAVSYRWLCNGEAIDGGENGTLSVEYVPGAKESVFQAVAVFSVDGMAAESNPSESVTVEYVPSGFVLFVR